MLDLRFEHFSGHVHNDFIATSEHGETSFTLIGAESLSHEAPAGMTRPPFVLTFHSRSEILLPQDLYALQHPELGTVDIFLVPVDRHEHGFVYQAVFN